MNSADQLEYGTDGPPSLDMLYSPDDILSWTKHDHCLHFYYSEAEYNEGKNMTAAVA
ncbi:hypothetical protein [Salibacterium qingdaonense]|uniref:Uncharacterized protein n=1 Tax=Salibacterium qingdaonense TaxID=266892 RepID=A0A1I4PLM4_9BACI|nr:hypothetical protein [Salibacterium qingdaonense]SFM28333.1 hypothetical protein SAMN04488054_12810 [Salibacterium qingdaonense]